MRIASLICAAALCAAPGLAHEGEEIARMEEGVWRIVTDLTMEGMVLGETMSESSADTSEECIEGEDAVLLDQAMNDETCEITPLSQDSHSVSASLYCEEDGFGMDGEVSVRLSPDRDLLYGTIEMFMDEGIMTLEATGELWGQRLRACDAG